MKLLLYSWNANNEQVLADNLIKLGFEVIWFHKECRHYTRDMELAMEMILFIHAKGVEVVISFNYFPILSMICNTCKIPYYSWVYDCPHFTLYAKQVTLPCNHIGIFDRKMVRQLEEYGVKTVFHVPLSVDTVYFDRIIVRASQEEKKKYQCDISFVGSLYTGEYDYYDKVVSGSYSSKMRGSGESSDADWGNVLNGLAEGKTIETGESSEALDLNMETILARQYFSYHTDYLKQSVLEGKIDLNRIRTQMEKQGLMLGEDYFARLEDILLPAVLEKKVTVEERRSLLTEVAKRFGGITESRRNAVYDGQTDQKFDIRLYTGSDTKGLPELDTLNYGTVDYHTQMPLVFASSRINLNISLRSIHSGIPLRVLDIMACGGFVLSNWQPEIAESFVDGVEIATFDSLEDCLDKIAYYLIHEDERNRVAAAGQRKVQELFSYQSGLEKLFI